MAQLLKIQHSLFLRPHSSSTCFQTGYVVNGVPTFTNAISASCPGQNAPAGGQWFDVRVDVNIKTAKIYLAGKFVREVKPHYPVKGQGGVLVANGYNNIAYFRNFEISKIDYSVTSCVVASSGPSGKQYFVLDANHGKWPSSGFCSALNNKDILNENQYSISAELFNKIGWKGVNSGHLGLLYNAKDERNYDFVYFRYCGHPLVLQFVFKLLIYNRQNIHNGVTISFLLFVFPFHIFTLAHSSRASLFFFFVCCFAMFYLTAFLKIFNAETEDDTSVYLSTVDEKNEPDRIIVI